MARRRPLDPKAESLRRRGCLYRKAHQVRDPLFSPGGFFDPRDLVQVKYEMLRCVSADGRPISQSAATFGFSRPSFYAAQAAFDRDGLVALVPQKPGPRRRHKLDAKVVAFLQQALSQDPSLGAKALAASVQDRFQRTVHPRSIQRVLASLSKK
jgi:transposase